MLIPIELQLSSIFKNKKILIVGVGNVLRADDGVGPYIISCFKEKKVGFDLLDTGTTPENFTEDIIKLKPEIIIIIDAAYMNKKPGEICFFNGDSIPETSISTHNISMRVISGLWKNLTNAEINFIGIEPENTNWEEDISQIVKKSADKLISLFLISAGTCLAP
ncbi:hydrogenase 3 maturation endopeptidase HyCI [Candidatus Desantisbacteria bacterium]|nr:hydrogenase 3 maturation endopeptidase HyCI [Candidatus Desantisbacteria bacterium]